MRPSIRHIAWLALVVLLLSPIAVALASASPAPVPVCAPCGEHLEYAADDHGYDVTVESSTATVRVHENGSATWIVTTRLVANESVERLRANETARTEIVRQSFTYRGLADDEIEVQSVEIAPNATMRMTYRMPDFGTWQNDVLLVEYFRSDPGEYLYWWDHPERLTVVGPPGTTVTSGLPGGTVDGRQVTASESAYAARGDGPFVAFGRSGDPLASAKTTMRITTVLAPTILTNLVVFVVIPGTILAIMLGQFTRIVREYDASTGREHQGRRTGIAAIVCVLGLFALGHPAGALLVMDSVDFVAPLSVAGGGFLAVGIATLVVPDRLDRAGVFAATGVAIGAGILAAATTPAVLSALTTAVADEVVLPTTAPRWVIPGVAVLLALPAGYAARQMAGWSGRLAVSLPVIPLVVGVLASVQLTARPGTLFMIVPIALSIGAVAIAIAALPLFALGGFLAVEPENRTH